ncbi:hypothetical protein P0D88_47615 [Paraburkholderia sp. RL18-103-BIB-C]|uniref:hypothetical protein n=1 Tax=Paraburkholderia sp. RL18-103-BIB-C TaxID=3031637 RepID=UPI0038BD5ED6
MKPLIKALGAMVVAATMTTHAQAATKALELDVTLFKDGQQIAAARDVIYSEMFGPKPFAYASGTEVGYATCTGSGQNIKLKSESVLVGRSLFIKPVSVDGNRVRLSVSALDTTLDGTHQTGPADCRSEVVDVQGWQKRVPRSTSLLDKPSTFPSRTPVTDSF